MSVATRPQLSHLRALESEAIHVMREVAAEFEKPVLLFSGGKDSIVLLRLAEKAFRPAPFPFPLMHVDTELIERDAKRNLWKYNPLAHWTDKDLWRRIHERNLPYNPLHDQGYSSIGCAPCTLPGNGREGRWAGTDKTECGLHVESF